MNKQRRQHIKKNIDALEAIKSNLECILSEEEDYFNNMPENLQGSMRGEDSEEAIDVLSEMIDIIDECIDGLSDII